MAEKLKRMATVWTDAGGVGKTAMTINVADYLGEQGEDVLCIDLDPQYGGLTRFIGLENARELQEHNVVDAIFEDEISLDQVILSSDDYDLNFDVIPSTRKLEHFSRKLTDINISKLLPLRLAIGGDELHQKYDYIFIDVQGSRSDLVSNAIVATRNVLVPIELTEKGAGGIEALEEYISTHQQTLNKERQVRGIEKSVQLGIIAVIPTMISHGTGNFKTLQKTEKNEWRALYSKNRPVTPFGIPEAQIMINALDNRMTLREFIQSETTREIRNQGNENIIAKRYRQVAEIVEDGSVKNTDGPYTKDVVMNSNQTVAVEATHSD